MLAIFIYNKGCVEIHFWFFSITLLVYIAIIYIIKFYIPFVNLYILHLIIFLNLIIYLISLIFIIQYYLCVCMYVSLAFIFFLFPIFTKAWSLLPINFPGYKVLRYSALLIKERIDGLMNIKWTLDTGLAF